MARPVVVHRQQQPAVDEVVPGRRRDAASRRLAASTTTARRGLREPGREVGGQRSARHGAMLLRWATPVSAAHDRRTPTPICATFDAAARAGWAHFLPAERLGEIALPHHRGRRLARPAGDARAARRRGRRAPSPASRWRARRRTTTRHRTSARCTCSTSARTPGAAASGGRCWKAAQDALRDAGYPEATLWTGSENHRPRALYEAAGWRLDGAERRFDYLGVELVNLRYRRRLAPG